MHDIVAGANTNLELSDLGLRIRKHICACTLHFHGAVALSMVLEHITYIASQASTNQRNYSPPSSETQHTKQAGVVRWDLPAR